MFVVHRYVVLDVFIATEDIAIAYSVSLQYIMMYVMCMVWKWCARLQLEYIV
jgi:hypothetical protein